jgi:phospholipid/cholesterol/gamma-HCH transport system ATP-binding protein
MGGTGLKNIVEVRNVFKSFDELEVLKGVSLTIEREKITTIIGKSGTGKSVLLKNIIGIMKPDSGEIIFNGENIVSMPAHKLLDLRKNIGYLFQDAALFDFMTVEENIAFPIVEQLGIRDRKILKDKVANLLELIELPGIEDKMPSELSGGMRKRVGLARAIAVEPKIVLFDEPTTGLDPILAESINELIMKVNRELKMTCVVISHDIASTFQRANKVAFLYEGNIEFFGTPKEAVNCEHEVLQKFISNSFKPL